MKTMRGERSSPKWALQNLSCLPLSRHRTNELLSLFVPLKAISVTSVSSSPNAPPTWLPTLASGGTCPHASSTTATELCWLTPTLLSILGRGKVKNFDIYFLFPFHFHLYRSTVYMYQRYTKWVNAIKTRMDPDEHIVGTHVTFSDAARNTLVTVQLGRGASIQLANTVINTGRSGATIQFGSLDFPAIVARTAVVPMNSIESEGPVGRPCSAEVATRRAHLPAPRLAVENPRRRIFVFELLSQPETPATKKVIAGGRISVVTANTTSLSTGLSAPEKNNAEASSSGGRFTRRQRRKKNAEFRAQQQLPIHPSNLPAQEPEATIPTQNGFAGLKWVKRNNSTGERKKSFWDQ
ncbi:hypothetical protein IEQ34_026784 [Dendrobium chrysotoxum]|uniref:Uncharacterized protein n=1 Tax=Dendrobium chrysotoxum TaxID=161865 RepID=A0AAV7FKU1_DENCH|nr:hypothetical protein IEQ34_026784 [Dendrobium chrysotoxum]